MKNVTQKEEIEELWENRGGWRSSVARRPQISGNVLAERRQLVSILQTKSPLKQCQEMHVIYFSMYSNSCEIVE
jgi:hypothetical protein